MLRPIKGVRFYEQYNLNIACIERERDNIRTKHGALFYITVSYLPPYFLETNNKMV